MAIGYQFLSQSEAAVIPLPQSTPYHGMWQVSGLIQNRAEELQEDYPGLSGPWTRFDAIFPRRKPGIYHIRITNPEFEILYGEDHPEVQLSKGKYFTERLFKSNGSRVTVSMLLSSGSGEDVITEIYADTNPDKIETARVINKLKFFPDPTPVQTPPVTKSRVVRRMMRSSNTGKAIVRIISF